MPKFFCFDAAMVVYVFERDNSSPAVNQPRISYGGKIYPIRSIRD